MTDDRTTTFEGGGTGAPTGASLQLVVVDQATSWVVPLDVGDRVIGRAEDADVRIDDHAISRAHVRIRVLAGGQVLVMDLGSRNGTRINGAPLACEQPLRPGDAVYLGRATLYLHVGDPSHWHRTIDVETLRRRAEQSGLRAPRGADATVEGARASGPRTIDLGDTKLLLADADSERAYALLARLADASIAVLVSGETGVGKELAALFLHRRSGRAGRFVSVNCAAIAEGVAESELFGHARGAFTGAQQARAGLIEAADGGTLFLDEVGELSLSMQAKLLRVLETKSVVRVGEVDARPVDLRVVSATHRDLEADVEAGRFRRDLLYRLVGAQVHLPPLRRRRAEILLLAHEFLRAACAGRPPPVLAPEVEEILLSYPWPGNVRELRNVVDYVGATCAAPIVTREHLPPSLREPASARVSSPPSPASTSTSQSFRAVADEVRDLEKRRIEEALDATDGNKTKAAALIGMPIRTFSEKVKQYGIRRGS